MYKSNQPPDIQHIIDLIKDCASMDEMFGTEEEFLSLAESMVSSDSELEEDDLSKAAGGYKAPTQDIVTQDKK